jgi:hypothetical protein
MIIKYTHINTRLKMTPVMFSDEVEIMTSLISQLPPTSSIVEWGSGGSTVTFSKQLSSEQHYTSIEHNIEWFDKVDKELKDINSTCTYLYRPVKPDCYTHGYGRPEEENPIGLDDYIFPGDFVLDADLYFIDGIARCTIALMLLGLAKNRNAVILIHDYTPDRHVYYNWIRKIYPRSEVLGTGLLRLYLQ